MVLFHVVISWALVIRIAWVGILRVVIGGLGVLVRLRIPAILVLRLILLTLPCGELLTLVILVVVILVILRKVFVIIGRLFLVLLVRSLRRLWPWLCILCQGWPSLGLIGRRDDNFLVLKDDSAVLTFCALEPLRFLGPLTAPRSLFLLGAVPTSAIIRLLANFTRGLLALRLIDYWAVWLFAGAFHRLLF